MIRALAWYYSGRCGAWLPEGGAPGARSWKRAAPALAATQELLALIGRPIRYFSKMTTEAQVCLCAAHMALEASEWRTRGAPDIGLLASGFDGCLAAQGEYFQDYITSGRSMGRGNLFVYTLPTSALSAVSLGLGLTGPTLHLHEDAGALAALVEHGTQMVAGGEADGILALYGDPHAAVCLAIDGAADMRYGEMLQPHLALPPLALAQALEAMIAE